MNSSSNSIASAVIVYPEESGELFAPEFRCRQIGCICILPDTHTVRNKVHEQASENYHYVLIHKRDISSIMEILSGYRILCVLPGSERGVPLADELARRLDILANDQEHATARCSKTEMAMTAKAAGLAIPWQRTIRSNAQLDDLINRELDLPMIIKPDNSMGSEDVHLCSSPSDLHSAFGEIIDSTNRLGRKNRQCVVQRFVTGIEYAIDTVSYKGRHRITGIWQYFKSDQHTLGVVPFISKRFISANGDIQKRLIQYTRDLLDAIGIKYGPAHTEVIVSEKDKVQLMEIGARLHGGCAAMQMSVLCSGQSQVGICADAYTNPAAFLQNYTQPYSLSLIGEIVLLIAPNNQHHINTTALKEICALPSVKHVTMNADTNQPVSRIAGLMMLTHTDVAQLSSDLEIIRTLEKTDLYIGQPVTQ